MAEEGPLKVEDPDMVTPMVLDDPAPAPPPSPVPSPVQVPPVSEQKTIIKTIMEKRAMMEVGDIWYPINFRWWDTWRRYVGYDEDDAAFVSTENHFPGTIDNSGLKGASDVEVDVRKLCDLDYALLPDVAYNLLREWYSGPGPDLPRRVVEVGNQKELKVEVFPYFVYYKSAASLCLRGDSQRCKTSEAPMMLDSTMLVEDAMKVVCEAAGVDEAYAKIYLVTEGGGGGGRDYVESKLSISGGGQGEGGGGAGGGEKLEIVDREGADQKRTLSELLFGQHTIQLFIEDRKWRFQLQVGDEVDTRDIDQVWYDSKVVEVVERDPVKGTTKVKVHFKCWESRWDDDVDVVSDRIQPLFSVTENWRAAMRLGSEIEVKGPQNKWYKGTVSEVEVGRRVRVSSMELSQSPEWKDWESEDICKSGVHIKMPPASSPAAAVKRSSSSNALVTTGGSSRTSPGGGHHVLGSSSTALTTTNHKPGGVYSSPYGSGTNGYGYGRMSTRGAPPEPGAVGLSNLGNTCFMNSMVQCLSNTEVLTNFFYSGRYESEINERNPLGTKGQLTRVYARLLKDMWSGDYTTVSPTELKRVISSYAPQFAGYQQHDSQELMSFLVDGLHEDLNRVRNKPYVEMKGFDDVPDEQAAAQAWRLHLLRNDSIVVDHAFGQLKSHVTCPKCGYQSVTFDPYSCLNLPLPVLNTVKITFTYFPLPFGTSPIRAMAQIPSQGTARDLKAWITEHIAVGTDAARQQQQQQEGVEDPDRMSVDDDSTASTTTSSSSSPPPLPTQQPPPPPARRAATRAIDLTDNYDKRVFALLEDTESIARLSKPQIDVHAYQLEHNPATDPEAFVFTVLFGKVRSVFGFPTPSKAYDRFGVPLRLSAKPGMTNHQIYIRVTASVRRLLREEAAPPLEGDRLFRLIYANATGATNEGEMPDDHSAFSIDRQRQTLVVLFSQEAFAEYVDKDLTERYLAHSSISRKDGGTPRKTITLNDCFEKFTEKEQLGEDDLWYCTKCKERLQAYKKIDVWSCPDILICQLKRFSYVQSYFVTREKIEDLVKFPVENLDLQPFIRGPIDPAAPPIYDLYAVSEHSGGLGGGHYTAVAKNCRNGKWYSFNDSYVSEIADDAAHSHIVTSRAYVLFYKRRSGSLKWAGARPPVDGQEPPRDDGHTGGALAGRGAS